MNKDQIKKVEESCKKEYGWSQYYQAAIPVYVKGAQFGYKMAGEWVKVEDRLPEVEPPFQESKYVECMDGTDIPFIGWYNRMSNQWHYAHIAATGIPNVRYWREYNFTPPTFSDEG